MPTVVSPGTMRVADLPPGQRAWLRAQRYDRYLDQHEGPIAWGDLLAPDPADRPEAAEFVRFDDHEVLLPVGRDHHAHLRRLRAVTGDDGRCLTLFLLDATADDAPGAGRFAFCEKAPAGGWYLCTVWHEWCSPR